VSGFALDKPFTLIFLFVALIVIIAIVMLAIAVFRKGKPK